MYSEILRAKQGSGCWSIVSAFPCANLFAGLQVDVISHVFVPCVQHRCKCSVNSILLFSTSAFVGRWSLFPHLVSCRQIVAYFLWRTEMSFSFHFGASHWYESNWGLWFTAAPWIRFLSSCMNSNAARRGALTQTTKVLNYKSFWRGHLSWCKGSRWKLCHSTLLDPLPMH